MRQTPIHPHTSPVTPQGELLLALRTFTHPPVHPSIHLNPLYSNSDSLPFIFCGDSCNTGVRLPWWLSKKLIPDVHHRFSSPSGHQYTDWPPGTGNEWRDRKIPPTAPILLSCFVSKQSPHSSLWYVIRLHEHSPHLPLAALLPPDFLSSSSILLCCHSPPVTGRKEGAKQRLRTASCFLSNTVSNPLCPGRKFFFFSSVFSVHLKPLGSMYEAIPFHKNTTIRVQTERARYHPVGVSVIRLTLSVWLEKRTGGK